jgi:thioredoxin-related protein
LQNTMRRLYLMTFFSVMCACMAAVAWAAETPLPAAHNLAQHAAAAVKQRAPLILMVSLTGCPFCEHIRKLHLAPLAQAGVPVRQIYLDSDASLIGFDGKPITQRQLAKKLAIQIAPTVFFFDARGKQIAEPLIGTLLDDFYGAYLDNAIDAAKKQLANQSK